MGFFEESYFSEGREQDGFSCFQERQRESATLERQQFHHYTPPHSSKERSKSTSNLENKNEVQNSEIQEKATGVTVESLLSDTSCVIFQNEMKRQFDEATEEPKVEDSNSSGSICCKKYRRCSSHDNLEALYNKSTKEARRISRVPSAEVLTDRGIFMYPSRYYVRPPHEHNICKSHHTSSSFDSRMINKQGSEKSSCKRHSHGLPPISNHHGKSEKNGEHLTEPASRHDGSCLGNHATRRNEEFVKGSDKKTETSEGERKSDTNSRGAIMEESLCTWNPHYSTATFQSATIAANELQSELKATEELLNSAARRRRYQDVWYSSAFASSGSLMNEATNSWPLQSNQLLDYSKYIPQPIASVPGYVNQTIPNTSQVVTCVPTTNCSSHSSELQHVNNIRDATTLVNQNLQLERQMMNLQLQLTELRNENAQLKIENQHLRQQLLQK